MSNDITVNESWIDKLVDELVNTKNETTVLCITNNQLKTLIDIIFNNTELDYGGDGLKITNDKVIIEYIRALDPVRYDAILNSLKDEREAELARLRAETPDKEA